MILRVIGGVLLCNVTMYVDLWSFSPCSMLQDCSNQRFSSSKVMPPILLISDSASNLHNGMPHRPFFEGINHVVKALRECSYEHMTLYELDGATGNERLYHHFLSLGYPGTMIELIKCRNHQTNLVEGGVVLTSSPRVLEVTISYHCSTLLRILFGLGVTGFA